MPTRVSLGRRAFVIFNQFFCVLVAIICIMPVLHILAISLSSKNAVISGHVSFWPVDFSLDNYNIVLRDEQFFTSFGVSVLRSVLGWAISLALTVLAAYPMSLRRSLFPARPFFVWYFMIAMLFNGGMIPTYLVVRATGVHDSIWALVLPGAVGTYNMILMMNFMKGLPDALCESAYIDGAGHLRTLTKIVLPLCLPSVATISIFIVLGHWNAWFDGMIYINKMSLKPVQTYLRSVIIVNAEVSDAAVFLEDVVANVSADGTNGAKIFLAMLPIMCVYPFLQKHFAKGIVRGSVKE